jgi:hypothetical protein
LREEPALGEMRERALATARDHHLAGERAAFLEILDRVEPLWANA